MKQFLYLDTDIVASIIAQAEKGLITQMMSEHGSEEGKEQQKSTAAHASASASGGFWKFLQAEAALGADAQIGSSKNVQSSSKEIVEKTLHDATFDVAYSYIHPHKSNVGEGSDDEDDAGDYIELKRVFTFADFSYFEGLFAKDGVIDLIKKMEAQKIEGEMETAKGGFSREQWRRVSSEIKRQLGETIKQNNKQYDDVATIIKLINSLVPYSRMLISSDGYLIPLDDKYFRIDPSNLGFKYGGEITCVGLITNIIGESTDPCDNKDVFATVQFSVNEILRSILPTKDKDLCVVHPIAVYYGE